MIHTNFLYTTVFLLFCTAAFVLLRLDAAMLDWITNRVERSAKIRSFKKRNALQRMMDRLLTRCADLIVSSRMPKIFYAFLTAGSAAAGYCVGRIIFSSLPIALAVGTFGLIAPLLFFSYRQTRQKTAHLDRLCSTMMILSNSYIVTEDFITSVEDNVDIVDCPAPFKNFLAYVTLLDSSVESSLRRLDLQMQNPFFSQWIDSLILAQEDRSLKYVTVAVVDSMHDVLSVQAESDAEMYAVWRDYLMTLVMIFSVPLIFKFTLPDAYLTLTTSAVGQGLFILLLIAVIFSVFCALKINKPLMI